MLALAVSSSLALLTPAASAARQVVQSVSTPAAAIAASSDGYLAVVTGDDTLQIWQLSSHALLRTIAASALGGIAHPASIAWDDDTHEVLLSKGTALRAVDRDGHLRDRPGDAVRFHPVAGGVAVRWLADQYGRWSAWDKDGTPVGAFADAKGDVVAAGDGKTAIATTATGLVRYALAPLGAPHAIALPQPPVGADDLSERTLAVDRTGGTAVVCTDAGNSLKAIAIVRDLARDRPSVQTVAMPDLYGCQVAIADGAGVAIVAGIDAMYAIDLASGAQRWRTPLAFAVSAFSNNLAIVGDAALVTQIDGSVGVYDVARGDALGQLGSSLERPTRVWFGAGDALVAVHPEPSSISARSRATPRCGRSATARSRPTATSTGATSTCSATTARCSSRARNRSTWRARISAASSSRPAPRATARRRPARPRASCACRRPTCSVRSTRTASCSRSSATAPALTTSC